MSRHLIVNITNTKKPHTTESLHFTNEQQSVHELTSLISSHLTADDVMLITIQRDCHSEVSTNE